MRVLLLLTSSNVGLSANHGTLVEVTLIDVRLGRLDDDLVGALAQMHSLLNGIELLVLLIRVVGLLGLLDGLGVHARVTSAHIFVSIRRSETLIHLLLLLLRRHADDRRRLFLHEVLLLTGNAGHGWLSVN